jgi:hypothetical protein
MDRKEFLSTLWKKAFRPLVLAIILCCGIVWLGENMKSVDMLSTVELALIIAIIIIGLALISMLLSKISSGIYFRLPDKVKQLLHIISTILNRLAFFGMIGILYYAYTDENYFIAGLCAFYIIQEIRRLFFIRASFHLKF